MGALALLAHHVSVADAAFSKAFLQYAAAADDLDTAAYTPTALNNPLRLELNVTLVQVLQNKITDTERLQKARRGLELLGGTKAQIDAMTPVIQTVDTAIAKMESSLTPGDALFQRGDPQKIIALAKEREAATKDIQALSYRANFESTQIFQHLIESQGKLTSSFVQDLNNEVPATQDDFDRRQNRYNDLSDYFSQIQRAYDDFSSITAGK